VPDSPLRCTAGQSGEFQAVVTDADTAQALGSGDLQVLGTPRLLAWLEQATCLAIEGSVAVDWTTVGAHVDLDHLAASQIGDRIECRAEITAVEGRRITYAVTASSNESLIARGKILRVAIQRSRSS
jgi:predicted thioesterase